MPDPRPLGNVARSVLHSVCGALEKSQDAIFDVVMNVHGEDVRAAILALKEVAAQNNLALRVITFMLADKHKDAEEVLMQAKLRKSFQDKSFQDKSASANASARKEPEREKQP